ncbi:MAG: TrkA family potassium uptake protein [Bacillota bacterium]
MANKKKTLQVAVIGLGRFGQSVAKTLTELGCDVLAIDSDMKKVEAVANTVTHAVQADSTDEENLKMLGLQNFDVVVLATGSCIQASILSAIIIKEMGVAQVIAKANSELHSKALEKIGVNKIVYPERDSGIKLAHSLMSMNLVEYLEISPEYQIAEVIIQSTFHGKTLKEADLRNRYGINVLAIRAGDTLNVSPQADDVLHEGDMLVVLGRTKDLKNFCENC